MKRETPGPKTDYIFRLTDDTGMFQHAKRGIPDPSWGYTTDDNARALIMAGLLYERHPERPYLNLLYRYFSFLLYAEKEGWFRNFMDYDRRFTEERGSEDCFGRCIWSLGFVTSLLFLPDDIRRVADELLQKTVDSCGGLHFLRAKAYAVLGLSRWPNKIADQYESLLAQDIAATYRLNAEKDWHWFENTMTYCNSIMPLALLEAHSKTGDKEFLEIGVESLEFLWDSTSRHDLFWPVGCEGWYPKGKAPAPYDQQPVEACGMLLACLKALTLTGNKKHRQRARACLDWYSGKNSLGVSLVDPDTGSCMDGIRSAGLNCNQGAESLISWQIARLAWGKKEKQREAQA